MGEAIIRGLDLLRERKTVIGRIASSTIGPGFSLSPTVDQPTVGKRPQIESPGEERKEFMFYVVVSGRRIWASLRRSQSGGR